MQSKNNTLLRTGRRTLAPAARISASLSGVATAQWTDDASVNTALATNCSGFIAHTIVRYEGKAKQRWRKLTDNDLMVINDKCDVLAGKIAARSGAANSCPIVRARVLSQVAERTHRPAPNPLLREPMQTRARPDSHRPSHDVASLPNRRMSPATVLAAALLLASATWAQSPGDLLHIGRGCPTSSGKPATLTADSFPKIGNPWTLSLSECRPNSPALLLFGGSQRNLDLTPLGAPGCSLLSSDEVGLTMLTDARGAASLGLQIPNSQALLGATFHNQFLVADPTVNGFGVVSSNGLSSKVGAKMACATTSAFSVWGAGHVSKGTKALLEFTYTDVNVGSHFKRGYNISGFRAPEAGLYYFHFDAVKDAFATGMTEDDVFVELIKWKPNGGSSVVAYAMSGQGTGKRGTMATSVALRLDQHEWVSAYVSSDGQPGNQPQRYLMSYHFSGFRIDTPHAFSVQRHSHQSSGALPANTKLWYQSQLWHPNWDGATFEAPETGNYFFSMSGVKDSYIHPGTTDDVYIQLWVDDGKTLKVLGQAMSGEGGGGRGTMAYTTIVRLEKGDKVTTYSYADGGKYRHLLRYEWTGFLVEHGSDLAVSSAGHVSTSGPTAMDYPYTATNSGAPLVGGKAWRVPKTGYYFLALTGVRDAYLSGTTLDDVFAVIYLNNAPLSGGGAWSGEGSGMRGTMAYSTVRFLKEGDMIYTAARSDDNQKRYLIKYELTASRLCD